jgi:hypothetical protein
LFSEALQILAIFSLWVNEDASGDFSFGSFLCVADKDKNCPYKKK